MKATIESARNSDNLHLGLRGQDGKVHKKHHSSHHKEEENEEIKAYLTKLQELVPFMPKNRKLSKLEVITYVIDYIRDLRQTLGLPPSASRFPMMDMDPMEMMSSAISLNVINSTDSESLLSSSNSHTHNRQPLSLISPSNNSSSCGSQEIPQLMDKSPSADVDTRPVSC